MVENLPWLNQPSKLEHALFTKAAMLHKYRRVHVTVMCFVCLFDWLLFVLLLSFFFCFLLRLFDLLASLIVFKSGPPKYDFQAF